MSVEEAGKLPGMIFDRDSLDLFAGRRIDIRDRIASRLTLFAMGRKQGEREGRMNIYIVRHGETLWNKEEVFRGRKDIPLNDNGMRQAERAGAYFAGQPIGRIVSSPLARARQTAEAIGKTTGVTVETMEDFTDINFGNGKACRFGRWKNATPPILHCGENHRKSCG